MFKLEKYLFYLLIFSIPFQTRVFLWSASVVENFNEWQSVFLYGTDLIILALFSFWIYRVSSRSTAVGSLQRRAAAMPSAKNPPIGGTKLFRLRELLLKLRSKSKRWFRGATPAILLFTFIFFAFISIFFAPYVGVGVYRFVKLLEFVGLFFYTAHILKKIKFEKVAGIFILGGIFQSIIAITQFLLQRSLGLKLLGEASLSAGRQDVAEFVAYGARFMRAYGTFPSPNVLAAYLALSFLFLITWYLASPSRVVTRSTAIGSLQRRAAAMPSAKNPPIGGTKLFRLRELLFVTRERASILVASFLSNSFVLVSLGIILIIFASLLTFSRAVIAVFTLVAIFYFSVILFSKKLKEYRKKAWQLIVPLITASLVFVTIYWPEVYSRVLTLFEFEDLALRERVFFNNLSYELIYFNFWGVGLGNYTLALRDMFGGLREGLYQPVHNIFLLSAAEVGWIGAALFIVFLSYILVKSAQRFHKEPDPIGLFVLTSMFFIVISGFFDHFYITLQQGGLMLWFILGIGYYYVKKG